MTRALALVPLALMLAGCWTPVAGQVDPTRYPPHPGACVVALEPAPSSGITIGGGAAGAPARIDCRQVRGRRRN